MSDMKYEAPETVEAAVALLAGAGGEAWVLAGGTDLLVQMHAELVQPDLIVDIKRITELREIGVEASGFRIGAAVAGAELGEHAELKAEWPGVVEAAELIGSTQIQGRASMGGNLCNGSPAADSVPALIAARATVSIVGPDGRREVPVETVITGPGQTSLLRGELVASFFLPRRGDGQGDAYLRFIPRTELDIAVVGAGVCLTREGDQCTGARVALGAVAPTPLLVEDAAAAIVGTTMDEAALANLAAAASAACDPIDDKRGTKEFRTEVAGVMAKRAALVAWERAARGTEQ